MALNSNLAISNENGVISFPLRICPHCHGAVDLDARFCKHCGNKIDEEKKARYTPKTKRTKVPLKTLDEIKAMERVLGTPTKNTPSKIRIADRNRMIFMLGICTGLRASDLLSLNASQFVNGNGTIYIIEKKTGKGRTIILPDNIKNAIERYIIRNKIAKDGLLFPSQKFGTAIDVCSWNDTIVAAAESLGWDKRLYGSHTVRKTYAYQFYTMANSISRERGYRALSVLCKELNHSSEAITLAYIGIDKEEICEICNLTTAQYDGLLNDINETED